MPRDKRQGDMDEPRTSNERNSRKQLKRMDVKPFRNHIFVSSFIASKTYAHYQRERERERDFVLSHSAHCCWFKSLKIQIK